METLLWLAVATNVLSLGVFTAPHQGTGTTASLLVGVEAAGLRGDAIQIQYEISGGPVAVPPRTVTDHAARVLTRHALQPGTYQLRLAATELASGRTASVVREIEVPNLTPGMSRLAMSDALLTASGVAGLTQADIEPDAALPVLGLPPTARRIFSRDEKLEVHAEFYEQPSELEFDTQLRVVTRLLSADGTVVFETEDTGTSEALTDNRWGYEHSTLVPIATLTPGAYVIQVVGETLYDVPASAARSIPITIVATPAENNR